MKINEELKSQIEKMQIISHSIVESAGSATIKIESKRRDGRPEDEMQFSMGAKGEAKDPIVGATFTFAGLSLMLSGVIGELDGVRATAFWQSISILASNITKLADLETERLGQKPARLNPTEFVQNIIQDSRSELGNEVADALQEALNQQYGLKPTTDDTTRPVTSENESDVIERIVSHVQSNQSTDDENSENVFSEAFKKLTEMGLSSNTAIDIISQIIDKED